MLGLCLYSCTSSTLIMILYFMSLSEQGMVVGGFGVGNESGYSDSWSRLCSCDFSQYCSGGEFSSGHGLRDKRERWSGSVWSLEASSVSGLGPGRGGVVLLVSDRRRHQHQLLQRRTGTERHIWCMWKYSSDELYDCAPQGREILEELKALPSRNVSVRVVTSIPTLAPNSTDLKTLREHGQQILIFHVTHFKPASFHSLTCII